MGSIEKNQKGLNELSLQELQIQISLGVIPTENKLATIIKRSQDLEVLKWAIKHRTAKVRAAAIENKNLPIGLFIHAGLFSKTATELNAYRYVVEHREKEMKYALKVIVEYPQLSIVFPDDESST